MIRCFLKILPLIALYACSVKENEMAFQRIDSPTGSPASEPYLFTDPSDQVFLSWIERADTLAVLKLAQLKEEAWTEPVTIASGTNWFVNWADYPMAVSNGKGKFLAHFLNRSGEGSFEYDVNITASQDGTTWSSPFILHDDGAKAEHGFVSLTPYGDDVLVSWLDGRNTVNDDPSAHHDHGHHGEMTVRSAVVSYTGQKLQEWELDSRACDCCQTTAAITTNGPVVIYRDRSDAEVRDISIVRLVDNKWTKPKPVYCDNWEINGCPVNGPRCEAIDNTLAIAWFTMAGDQAQVNVIFSVDGGETFGAPITVSSNSAIGRVDVVLLDETTALVSWMEEAQIKLRKVYSNGKTGPVTTIAKSSESRSSGFPQITKAGNTILIAWTDSSEGTIKIGKVEL
jgi:hypothetical protein